MDGEKEAERRNAELHANPPVILAGVIRNGNLTDSEKRHTYALDDYDSRIGVLVILPRTDSMVDESVIDYAATTLTDAAQRLRQIQQTEGAEISGVRTGRSR